MREWAKKLHQKLHQEILRFEKKWQAGQIHSRPLFLIGAVICFFVSVLAEGVLLDVVLPHLETRWVLKAVLEILGALFFILIFAFAFRQKKERSFLFWYPWSMAFIAVIGTIFLNVRQSQVNNNFTQIIAGTNTFYLDLLSATNSFFTSSNSFLLGQIDSLKSQLSDTQKQLSDNKQDSDNQIINLKLDLQKTAEDRDNAMQSYNQLMSLPKTATEMFMSTTGAITELTRARGSWLTDCVMR
jgi:hypothetical protein